MSTKLRWIGYDYRQLYRKHHGHIPHGWHVHHINGKHKDNRIENLIAIPEYIHVMAHMMFILPSRDVLELWMEDYDPAWVKRTKSQKRAHARILEKNMFTRKGKLRRMVKKPKIKREPIILDYRPYNLTPSPGSVILN